MKKKAFLIHGWEGHPEHGWWPWLKNKLEKEGFSVFVPAMPDTNHPKMDAWVNHLTKIVETPNKDCYFVGHSLGCITILRYLETLKLNENIGGAVLVAGFSDDLEFKELDSFFTKSIDWKKIKAHCKKIVAIHSDNDPYVPLKHGDIFKEKLGVELIVQHNMKHFSGDDGIIELPVALESVLKISE
ncbi:MAG: alpha/beta hydrolase [Candidatus Aenigmatarchaeota archaeon]